MMSDKAMQSDIDIEDLLHALLILRLGSIENPIMEECMAILAADTPNEVFL